MTRVPDRKRPRDCHAAAHLPGKARCEHLRIRRPPYHNERVAVAARSGEHASCGPGRSYLKVEL